MVVNGCIILKISSASGTSKELIVRYFACQKSDAVHYSPKPIMNNHFLFSRVGDKG